MQAPKNSFKPVNICLTKIKRLGNDIWYLIVHGNSDGTSEVTNTEKLEGSKIDFY